MKLTTVTCKSFCVLMGSELCYLWMSSSDMSQFAEHIHYKVHNIVFLESVYSTKCLAVWENGSAQNTIFIDLFLVMELIIVIFVVSACLIPSQPSTFL